MRLRVRDSFPSSSKTLMEWIIRHSSLRLVVDRRFTVGCVWVGLRFVFSSLVWLVLAGLGLGRFCPVDLVFTDLGFGLLLSGLYCLQWSEF